jgi:hypothetical protein
MVSALLGGPSTSPLDITMDSFFVRLLLLITGLVVIVAALLSVGLWLGRMWARQHPQAEGQRQIITPTGLVLYGCQTLLLFLGLAARQLQPHGPLGEFLNTPGGLITYIACLIVGFSVAAAAFAKLGHPVARERSDRDG